MYEDALSEVSKRLKTEALTQKEIIDTLQKEIDEFEKEYTLQGIEPFSDEMTARTESDFVKLIYSHLGVCPKAVTVRYTLHSCLPEMENEITFYSCSDELIKKKIDFLKETKQISKHF